MGLLELASGNSIWRGIDYFPKKKCSLGKKSLFGYIREKSIKIRTSGTVAKRPYPIRRKM